MPWAFPRPRAIYASPGKIALIGSTSEEAMTWRAGLKGMVHDEITIERADHLLESIYHGKVADLYVISAQAGGSIEVAAPDLRSACAQGDAKAPESSSCMVRKTVAKPSWRSIIGANDLITRGADPEEMALRIAHPDAAQERGRSVEDDAR